MGLIPNDSNPGGGNGGPDGGNGCSTWTYGFPGTEGTSFEMLVVVVVAGWINIQLWILGSGGAGGGVAMVVYR